MKRIIHVVRIESPPADVFRAISTAEGLSSWWSKQVKAGSQVGGIVDFTFVPEFNPRMRIEALEEPSKLRWKCVGGHDAWADNEFEFRLEPGGPGTQLTFIQDYARELDDVSYGTYNFNWGSYLESLRLYCQQGRGKPFDPERGIAD